LGGLHRALEERQLCRPGYLVTSCNLHNRQLAVVNPIKQTMGEGGWEKKNIMQLLHKVYDLQDFMDLAVWKVRVEEAIVFLEQHGSSTTTYVGQTQGDQQFADKWETVKTFRPFQPMLTDTELKRTSFKIPAPVLTRWWSVGETADFQATLTVCDPKLRSHQESKANKFVSVAVGRTLKTRDTGI
jgi:hypothetical protein